MKKWIYPLSLIILFFILIILTVPEGAVFGSHTDWLSQHAALAGTIRDACLEQHTLLPSWIELGGGSNGFQFSYYGFLRPDILISCLLPQVPAIHILTCYMLAVYLVSVLLCYVWLRSENIPPLLSFTGSVLFMTAGCMFHMHRQVMFVNYLPFLLCAFLCVRKKKIRWLPLCLCLLCLSSFYFAISAFAAVGWYWYRQEGNSFWKDSFLKKYIPCALTGAALSAALLLPTALVLLEHGRSGSKMSLLTLLELFAPNPVLNNLLFNEYGMGVTFLCLYAILAGLSLKKFRIDSILFLLFGVFGVFSWLLNGTLYARPKILIPFLPFVILLCVRYLKDAALPALQKARPLPLYPFAVILPVGLLWFSQKQFPWILAEAAILFLIVLLSRACISRPRSQRGCAEKTCKIRMAWRHIAGKPVILFCAVPLLLLSPIGMYLTTAGTEDWVKRSDASPGLTSEESEAADMDPLYHFDSLLSPLINANRLTKAGMSRSTMYSSVTSQAYSSLYYDTLMTPVRINNRVAILTSDNPFMLHLLGVRYLETSADAVPTGYKVIQQSGDTVLAENDNVLPRAYFTSDIITQDLFEKADPLGKLDMLARKTMVDFSKANVPGAGRSGSVHSAADRSGSDFSWAGCPGEADTFESRMEPYIPELTAGPLPDGLTAVKSGNTYDISAEKSCTLDLHIDNPQPGRILLLSFRVKNQTWNPIVIDINGIRNKLSGAFAPYPNGNRCFHYQFSSDAGEGIADLSVTLSKGKYEISDIQWHLYDQDLLDEKSFTPVTLSDDSTDSSTGIGHPFTVLSGTAAADEDGCLATSIPVQNGLEILVDGRPAEILTVNEAFAGAFLPEGEHHIEIRFSPPGKSAGIFISLAAAAGYAVFLAAGTVKRLPNKKPPRNKKLLWNNKNNKLPRAHTKGRDMK